MGAQDKKVTMKIYDGHDNELMAVRKMQRDGNDLVITSKIFGAMPMKARLKPEDARAALRLLDFKTILFLLTMPFRQAKASSDNDR